MMKNKQRIRRFLLPLTLLIAVLTLLWPVASAQAVDDAFDSAQSIYAALKGSEPFADSGQGFFNAVASSTSDLATSNSHSDPSLVAFLESKTKQANLSPEDVLNTITVNDTPPTPLAIGQCGVSELVRTFSVSSTDSVGSLEVGFNANHSHRGDIRVRLVSPSGTSIELISPDAGDSNANYDVRLIDTTTDPLHNGSNDNTSRPIYDRLANPSNSLNGFNGEPINGTWTLTICDTNNDSNTGTYNRSTFIFEMVSTCSPTIVSRTNGHWGSPWTWDLLRVPNSSDVVQIKHKVTAPPGGSSRPTIAQLCVDLNGELQSRQGESLEINVTGEIQNLGKIFGRDGADGSGAQCGKPGSSIRLWGSPIYNANGATVQAGNGGKGDDCGGNGGATYVYGQNTSNRGEIYGGNGGKATITAGHGGETHVWGKHQLYGGSLVNSGKAYGGNGGKSSAGAGGNGGRLKLISLPNVFLAGGTHHAGNGGTGSTGNGSDGDVIIEPTLIDLSGDRTQVRGGNITVFAGDDSYLDLKNLNATAVSASGDITLAVGSNGVVDLSGNSGTVLQANGSVKILADNVLLDQGVALEDVINATDITTGAGQVLRDVSLSGPKQAHLQAGVALQLSLTVLNGGPEQDTYTLSVSDTAGWNPSLSSTSETVDGINSTDLTLDVTPPTSAAHGDTNTVTVTATSQGDPAEVAELKIVLTITDHSSSGGVNITEVTPDYGLNDGPSTTYIYGSGFSEPLTVRLGPTQTLDVDFVRLGEEPQRIRAVVPQTVTVGVYDVTVETESGQATLADAYEVLDAGTTDDLLSSGDWMWTDPMPMRVNYANSGLGLNVQHLGGTRTVDTITVTFRLDSPSGPLLGHGYTTPLPPDSTKPTGKVTWTPREPSDPYDDPVDYTVCAIIDPDNEVEETNENNNVICRTITVLPPVCLRDDPRPGCPKDSEPPEVDGFVIQDDALSTVDTSVTLDVTATDYGTPTSGVNAIKYIEFEYILGARRWVPIQGQQTWIDYDTAQLDYPWELIETYGMRYMQAWAADGDRNISFDRERLISLGAGADVIDLVPTVQEDTVRRDDVVFYRILLEEGDSLSATMTPTNARDPDMYIWGSNQSQPWYDPEPDAATGVEQVQFTAPVRGTYQIEIHGPSNGRARYRLEFGATHLSQQVQPNGLNREPRDAPEDPAVPLDDWPEFYDVGLPPEGPTTVDEGSQLYLPLVIR